MQMMDEFTPFLHLLVAFVGVPAVAIVVARSAWQGKPEGWDRSMYWTAYAASLIVAAFLVYWAQQMHADVRSWQYLAQLAVLYLGLGMAGVSLGCFVGILVFGRGKASRRPDEQ